MKRPQKRKRSLDESLNALQGLGRIAMMRILKAATAEHLSFTQMDEAACPSYQTEWRTGYPCV